MLLSLVLTTLVSAPPEPTKPTPWQDDPVCRMVFHAVLEGLYEDGVQDAVVDAVVPHNPKGDPVKASFVAGCPLCLPVYEAFSAYQKRPRFAGEARSTLGKGLSEAEVKAFTSGARLAALAPLVQRYVGKRLASMRLTDAEKADWTAKLSERSGQGMSLLGLLIGTDPAYKGWSQYTGCAACNGTTDACRVLKAESKKP